MAAALTWVGVLTTTACGGSSTGSSVVHDAGHTSDARDTADAGCVNTGCVVAPADGGSGGSYTLTNMQQACAGGATGADLLALVNAVSTGTYTPDTQRPAPAPAWTGSTSPSALTLTATYSAASILCTPPPVYNCPPGAPCATPGPPSVSTTLTITFKTADGTFNETLAATASYTTGASDAQWTATLQATDIKGTYPFSGPASKVRLEFDGPLGPGTQSGIISELTATESYGGGEWSASPVTDAGVGDAGANDAGANDAAHD